MTIFNPELHPIEFENEIALISNDAENLRNINTNEFLDRILDIIKNYFSFYNVLKVDFIGFKTIDNSSSTPIVLRNEKNKDYNEDLLKKSIFFREKVNPKVNISNLIFEDKSSKINNFFISLSLNDIELIDEDAKELSYLFMKTQDNISNNYSKCEINNLKSNYANLDLQNVVKNSYAERVQSSFEVSKHEYKKFLEKLLIENNKLIIFQSVHFKIHNRYRPLGLILQFSFNEEKFKVLGKEQKHSFLKRVILYTNRIFSTCERYYLHTLTKEYDKSITKTAITSILVDSYSHNISAHSLNYLQSLFSRRSELFLKENHHLSAHFIRMKELEINHLSYNDFFSANLHNRYEKSEDEQNSIFSEDLNYQVAIGQEDSTNTIYYGNILDYLLYAPESKGVNSLQYIHPKESNTNKKIPFPLDYAIAPLMGYLRDKGGFWSGILRDNAATPNRITNLYEVLMEFCNNPLFLGTITAAEQIFIIKVHTHIGENNTDSLFCTINLKDFVEQEFSKHDTVKTESDEDVIPKHHTALSFTRLGKNHKALREQLEKISILLPGGIVGRQAFYTIIENSLRNAKHIPGDHLQSVRKNGLKLHFHFKPNVTFIKQRQALLKVILSLDYDLEKEKEPTSDFKTGIKKTLLKSIKKSYKDIINENGEPLLGGSSQDKICASALLNKQFSKVQHKDGPLKNYYPWIKYNLYTKCAMSNGLEGYENPEVFIEKIEVDSKGIFSKQFYLWHATDVVNLDIVATGYHKELIPRFKIAYTKDSDDTKINELKRAGVTRIVKFDKENSEEPGFTKLYKMWNEQWLIKPPQNFSFTLNKEYHIDIPTKNSNNPKFKLETAHGPSQYNANICKWRNHGQLKSYFFSEEALKQDSYIQQEFIETLFTKIIIIDKRLYGRLFDYSEQAKSLAGTTQVTSGKENSVSGKEENLGKIDLVFPKSLHLHVFDEIEADFLIKEIDNQTVSATEEVTTSVDSSNVSEKQKNDQPDSKVDHVKDLEENETSDQNNGNSSEKITLTKLLDEGIANNFNFFIIHLSFIEELFKKVTDKENKKMIDWFIETHLYENDNGEKTRGLPENFVFGVTTGRGRSNWITDEVSEKYRSNCLHLPIESLQTAMDQGINFKDDFDIKFNLCKVLFGS